MEETVEVIKNITELKESTIIIETEKTFTQKLEILLNSSFHEKYEIKLNPLNIRLLLDILK